MSTYERADAIESLAETLAEAWRDLLSDGLHTGEKAEALRVEVVDSARQLGIAEDVYHRAVQIMKGEEND
jgi:hypothetical protein